MKLLEYILLGASILSGLCVIWSGSRLPRRTAILILGGLLGILLLHLRIDQWRLFMLPVYGITAIVAIRCLFKSRNRIPRPPKRLKSILFSLLALLAGRLAWGIPSLLPLSKVWRKR